MDRPRELGWYGRGDGPTVVLVGGIHGNEPAGVIAIERVLEELQARRPPASGRILGLAGHPPGLRANVRFVDRDLNRRWTVEALAELRARDRSSDGVEDAEQVGLLELFETLGADLVVLDLHSFSAEGPAFSVMSNHPQNRALAYELRVPIIVGLADAVPGTLLDYLARLGHRAIGFEGGQHRDPGTIELDVAAIWVALVAVGVLEPEGVPDLDEYRWALDRARGGLPRAVEIVHRHGIDTADQFMMDPGWRNFQPVGRGERVASDRGGPVPSPEPGVILMPLYQALGSDGFFVAREVG